MDGIILTPLKKIHHPLGDIFHAIKKSDNGFVNFGEAYFSSINQGCVKGWKKHTKMVLNLVVPIGEIKFVIYNDFLEESYSVKISQKNYQRLTIEPGLWVAFKGIDKINILLNVASMEHDSSESESTLIDTFSFSKLGNI
jgi:dTDP-4-dehydrorhamnose 3,5-epimerase